MEEVKSFPSIRPGDIVITDCDDIFLQTGRTDKAKAITLYHRSGGWKNDSQTEKRKVLGSFPELILQCERKQNACLVLTALDPDTLKKDWYLSSGQAWPLCIPVICTASKSKT